MKSATRSSAAVSPPLRPDVPVARVGKLAERIADRIKTEIMETGWPVGRSLGNEQQLMTHYGISRATFREAVRQLERNGLAAMKRGAGGGLVVLEPARTAAVYALASYLELLHIAPAELIETRLVLDSLSVQLASERITDIDVASIRQRLAALVEAPLDDLESEAERHLQLRQLISDLARNPAAALLTDALQHLTANVMIPGLTIARVRQPTLAARDRAVRIAEAIIAGDELKARQSIVDDLLVAQSLMEKRERRLRRRGRASSDAMLLESRSGIASRAVDQKLGHRVSVAISRDIVERALPESERLGSESELQTRYGISRAILREAIRILERHELIRIKRGHGGGITVGTPNADYTLAMAEAFLGFVKLKPRHFYEAWRALQVAAAQLCAERLVSESVVRIEAVLEWERKANANELLSAMSALHGLIAELSGNRPLSLFCRVLDRVALKYPAGTPTADVAQLLCQSHRDLGTALLQRDPGMSRRSMLRHLKLVDALFGDDARRQWLVGAKAQTVLTQL